MKNHRFRPGGSVAPLALLWAALLGVSIPAAPQVWPPVTDAQKAVKEAPAQPGAPAVYLYRERTSNHDEWTFSEFCRLKILTPAGKDYGTVEVPFSEAWNVERIRARVIKPDGRIANFTGQIFEKTVLQVGGFKRLVKTFALPDLEVGSIIDYRYDLKLDLEKAASARSLSLERWKPEEGGVPNGLSLLSYTVELWDFNAPLYTYKAKYTYIPFGGGQASLGDTNLRLAWVSYGLMWGPPVMQDGKVVLEVEGIPAREKEEWPAPEDEGRIGVIFFMCSTKILRAEDYWALESAGWQKAVRKFLKGDDGVAAESRTVAAGAGTTAGKLQALYLRAQGIKNLSYDKDMTPSRRIELKIKDNRNVGEVLKRNAGLRSDITRTFVALARAAGFTADVARVATRDDKFFHENILGLYGQFDCEVAVVTVDGRDMFFDPATPGCPMGLVRWNATDTTYIRSSGEPGKFSTIPLDPPERSESRRTFNLRLDGEGGLSGTASLMYTGQEALDIRLEYLGTDEPELKNRLAEKMASVLPEGGRASVLKIENMSGSADELRLEFEITVPRAATAAGDRMILPLVPYRAGWREAFRHARRAGSVYFPYLRRESDDILIAIPEGLKVETVPPASQSERTFAFYSLAPGVEGGTKLRVRRDVTIRKTWVQADQYPVLKSFFDQVRAGDDGQIVISAEKK